LRQQRANAASKALAVRAAPPSAAAATTGFVEDECMEDRIQTPFDYPSVAAAYLYHMLEISVKY